MTDRQAPGLARMYAATPPGLCPFCLDPLPSSRTKPRKHCGDPVCKTAYNRTYRRDHPQQERKRIRRAIVVSEYKYKRGGSVLRAQKLECGHWWYPPYPMYNKTARSRYCAECERQHGNEEDGD